MGVCEMVDRSHCPAGAGAGCACCRSTAGIGSTARAHGKQLLIAGQTIGKNRAVERQRFERPSSSSEGLIKSASPVKLELDSSSVCAGSDGGAELRIIENVVKGLLHVLSLIPTLVGQLDALLPELADLPSLPPLVASLTHAVFLLAIAVAVGTLLADGCVCAPRYA